MRDANEYPFLEKEAVASDGGEHPNAVHLPNKTIIDIDEKRITIITRTWHDAEFFEEGKPPIANFEKTVFVTQTPEEFDAFVQAHNQFVQTLMGLALQQLMSIFRCHVASTGVKNEKKNFIAFDSCLFNCCHKRARKKREHTADKATTATK